VLDNKNCNISSVYCFDQGFLIPLSRLHFQRSSATRSKCFLLIHKLQAADQKRIYLLTVDESGYAPTYSTGQKNVIPIERHWVLTKNI
jgi:hypothetical protein